MLHSIQIAFIVFLSLILVIANTQAELLGRSLLAPPVGYNVFNQVTVEETVNLFLEKIEWHKSSDHSKEAFKNVLLQWQKEALVNFGFDYGRSSLDSLYNTYISPQVMSMFQETKDFGELLKWSLVFTGRINETLNIFYAQLKKRNIFISFDKIIFHDNPQKGARFSLGIPDKNEPDDRQAIRDWHLTDSDFNSQGLSCVLYVNYSLFLRFHDSDNRFMLAHELGHAAFSTEGFSPSTEVVDRLQSGITDNPYAKHIQFDFSPLEEITVMPFNDYIAHVVLESFADWFAYTYVLPRDERDIIAASTFLQTAEIYNSNIRFFKEKLTEKLAYLIVIIDAIGVVANESEIVEFRENILSEVDRTEERRYFDGLYESLISFYNSLQPTNIISNNSPEKIKKNIKNRHSFDISG